MFLISLGLIPRSLLRNKSGLGFASFDTPLQAAGWFIYINY